MQLIQFFFLSIRKFDEDKTIRFGDSNKLLIMIDIYIGSELIEEGSCI